MFKKNFIMIKNLPYHKTLLFDNIPYDKLVYLVDLQMYQFEYEAANPVKINIVYMKLLLF